MYGSGAAAFDAQGPSSSSPLFRKTKLCKFFQQGKCIRSEDCNYAHCEEELQPLPDFSRTRLCPFLRETGHCSKGARCNFAHTPEDLRARTRGHAQLIEDFKILLAAGAAQGPAAAQPAPQPRAPGWVPAASATATWVAPNGQACTGSQPGLVLPIARRAPQQPAPQPALCAPPPAPFHAAQQPFLRQAPSPAKGAVARMAPACLAVPTRGPSLHEPAPSAGRAPSKQSEARRLKDVEGDFSDEPSWSRQSTATPEGEIGEEFSRQNSEVWEWLVANEFRGAAIEGAPKAAREAGKPPQSLPAAYGLPFAVKNSFMDFEDGEYEAAAPLRRVRSTGSLPASGP